MSIRSIKGSPQLTRLLRELPEASLAQLVQQDPFRHASSDGPSDNPAGGLDSRKKAHEAFLRLPKAELAKVEQEAARITRLNSDRADALHLRLADGIDFDCRTELEQLPGALARSTDSYCHRRGLFRGIERAMQLRSYREHRTVYEAHDLQAPVNLMIADLDLQELEEIIGDKMNLFGGCRVEAVELPESAQTDREIMLAVTTGGALASQRVFEPDRQIEVIQFRPATELILLYRPALGRIKVCGRDWHDRKSVATLFAERILGEHLSERPLTQRNYNLRPFTRTLRPDIPGTLTDRIVELHVTLVRYALGGYGRKVTVTALPGEPIDVVARSVLKGLGARGMGGRFYVMSSYS